MSQDSLLPFIKRSRAIKPQSALMSSTVTLEELQNDSGPPEIPAEEIQFGTSHIFFFEMKFSVLIKR